VRVALISEGTYPYRSGAVGTWCHGLVRGLDEHTFWLLSLAEGTPVVRHPVPPNVAKLVTVPLRGAPVAPTRPVEVRQHARAATHAAVLLCRGMLTGSPEMFRSGLRRLAGLAADGTHPLARVPLGPVLLDAWRATSDPYLPRPTVPDAEYAATVLELAVRPLAVPVPDVDLCHTVHNGRSLLVALAGKWRGGIPFLFTEHEPYLADPLLEKVGALPGARAVLLRFLRSLSQLGYAEAEAIVPASERMRRWAEQHDADRSRVTQIPPGVDPTGHPPLRDDPGEPVIAWLGEPAALGLALHAFALVRQRVPDARLIVIGPAPERRPRLPGVHFSGPVTGLRALFGMARVLALSGTHEAMPYPLIEAMLCGRPTVCTDNGGLSGTVGLGAQVVPPNDPVRLAAACAGLLTDARLRRELGTSARTRALTLFRLGTMLDRYRALYRESGLSQKLSIP
jgi:glycosyltransferase involved in cell wall biosynthesis